MPPKRKKKGKGDGKKGSSKRDEPEDLSLSFLIRNYDRVCRRIGISVDASLMAQLHHAKEEGGQVKQLCLDGDLGPAGARALTHALLGMEPASRHVYGHLRALRCWRCGLTDDGVASLVQLLHVDGGRGGGGGGSGGGGGGSGGGGGAAGAGGDEAPIGKRPELALLELMDNRLTDVSCALLGEALAFGGCTTLHTLQLDLNEGIGAVGVVALCAGLRSNSTLRKLSLTYCAVEGAEGGTAIGEMLAAPGCAVKELLLQGNRLGGAGLMPIATALKRNGTLTALNLADNQVGEDLDAIAKLRDALLINVTLSHLWLESNLIGVAGGELLRPALASERKTLKHFTVDTSLPTELYAALCRVDMPGKKKKKGKKGKKGKKKKRR
eukprot:PLAT10746.8.p1 GENE.PLAT10746.8~~PLAT10746.8.p1  ORF type:complete len:392 (-),score=176.22 PLAT10746.8:24-1169(-)